MTNNHQQGNNGSPRTDGGTVAEPTDSVHASDLTAFQHSILRVLADEARYGLAIKRELEDYYSKEINHGRLYPNLDRLVDGGLVTKRELDKRTNEYELTEGGREVYVAYVDYLAAPIVDGDETAPSATNATTVRTDGGAE